MLFYCNWLLIPVHLIWCKKDDATITVPKFAITEGCFKNGRF